MKRRERHYWLDRSENVDKLYWGIVAVCATLFGADLLYHKHVHFNWEAWIGFYGIFGFVACVFLVLAAKELRKLLKRDEDYYDR